MKKTFLCMMVIAIVCASCEKSMLHEDESGNTGKKKSITFKMKGGFGTPQRRANGSGQRLSTQVKGSAMTDVWVLDYVNGELKQKVHQGDNTASDFGSPTLSLSMGNHELYFVCSMGGTPTLNVDEHKITWGIPRDTFWKKITKNIKTNTAGNMTITLDRVATRLSANIEDALPVGLAKVEITPTKWYYGLNYFTGNGTDMKSDVFTINVPTSYAGRTNTRVYIFGLAQDEEFATNATITAKEDNGNVLATQTITGAPMQKNRSTDYTGTLFLSDNSLGLSINDEWNTAWNGTW